MSNKKYSKLNLFIRSAIFSVVSILLILVASSIIMLSVVLPLKYRFKIIRFVLGVYIKALEVICHIKYEVTGLRHLPKDRACIVMSKHSSAWETFFLPLYLNDPAIIAKRELLWVPFFGWALAVSKPITINRSKKSSAMQQVIMKGRKALKQGRWIMIFPEGTRIPYGQAGTYRLGGARLAVQTHTPVIPVAHNAGKFWGKRKFIKQPGTVKISFGELIEVEGREPADVMAEVKDWIEGNI